VTFFVDTNVIIYAAAESPYREPCMEILAAVASGAGGRTSTAVLEELWHIERSVRIAGLDGITDRAYRVFTPLLPVTDRALRSALDLQAPNGLGTNDRVHVGTCIDHGITVIATADASFVGLGALRRVDPLDDDQRRGLLGARTS
jgi:predicted nucleic acid-binding protein